MTDQQKIKNLEAENQNLKTHLKEGKKVFSVLNDVLGIQAAAESGMLMLKIPGIITKVQRNPDLMENVQNFLTKINALEL